MFGGPPSLASVPGHIKAAINPDQFSFFIWGEIADLGSIDPCFNRNGLFLKLPLNFSNGSGFGNQQLSTPQFERNIKGLLTVFLELFLTLIPSSACMAAKFILALLPVGALYHSLLVTFSLWFFLFIFSMRLYTNVLFKHKRSQNGIP